MATTYFVRTTYSDDGNSGTSYDEAFLTYQHALDTVAAGDNIIVCADGVHAPTSTIDVDQTSGTNIAYINTYGANALGVVDGTQAVIDGSGISAADTVEMSTVDFYRFQSLRFTGGTAQGFNAPLGSTNLFFRNCRFDGAATNGFISASVNTTLVNCELDSCTQRGGQLTGDGSRLINCSLHHNGWYGTVLDGAGALVNGCLFYQNGTDGLYVVNDLAGMSLIGNVFHGGSGSDDGIYLDVVLNSSSATIANNIIANHGGYALSVNGTPDGWGLCDYNCFYNNTSGASDLADGTYGDNNVLLDPQFVSTTDGAENFTLKRSSPCLNAGFGPNSR